MANRTTATEVRTIIDTTLTDPEITSYITSANLIINTNTSLSTLGDDILEEIEKWLSAHLISITKERQAIKETIGDASVSYADIFGEDFKASTWGQMILILDTTGTFAKLGLKQASLYAVTSFNGK